MGSAGPIPIRSGLIGGREVRWKGPSVPVKTGCANTVDRLGRKYMDYDLVRKDRRGKRTLEDTRLGIVYR